MEKLTPKMAVNLLRKEGLNVTLEEAEEILIVIYILAEMAVNQILRHENC